MISTKCFLNTAKDETYILKRYKRKENSPYEYESFPDITFKGKIANNPEEKMYRIQKGVHGSNDSVYIVASNLPTDLLVGDKIEMLGKIYTVESIGYYYELGKFVNAGILSDEYIVSRCPKGITMG